MIQKKTIEIDGTKISYIEGYPDEPDRIVQSIILVHGLFTGSISWEEIAGKLSNYYRILAPDLPGQGESETWKNTDVNFTRYAAFVRTFCDRVGVSRAIIVGHSMGGGIAIVATSMYKNIFYKAVFMDSVSYPFRKPLKGKIATAPWLGEFIFKKVYGWGMFRSYFAGDVIYDKKKLNEKRLLKYYDYFNTPERRDFSYKLLKMVSNTEEIVSHIKNVEVPVLIIWGSNDKLIPISCGHRLSKDIQNAKIEIVPSCGHAPQEEQPEKTVEILRGFFQ